MWGLWSLTRLNLLFQMKAALRETVLFGRAAEPCLQTAGMWDVWSGGSGSEERMPSMSMFVQGWLSIQPPVTCCEDQRV